MPIYSFPVMLYLGIVLGAYGAGRIVLESTRDKQDRVSRINVAQAISTGFVAISVVAFAMAWWRSTR